VVRDKASWTNANRLYENLSVLWGAAGGPWGVAGGGQAARAEPIKPIGMRVDRVGICPTNNFSNSSRLKL
jgi:hypothetical protein